MITAKKILLPAIAVSPVAAASVGKSDQWSGIREKGVGIAHQPHYPSFP
jgi:hypothetical protein